MTSYYFDNNATTRVLPEVLEAMLPWFTEHYGNPSSSHQFGQFAKEALMTARAAVAKFLHASPVEIVFTSGATESNHMAIISALALHPNRSRIVTSAVEHASTLRLLDELSRTGIEVIQVPVNAKGELNLIRLKEAVNENTALVTLMHANNETGVIFPIAEVASIAHEKGALFHTDAAQTAGKIALDVAQIACDFLSFSGHKLHAPMGVGVLYVKKGLTAKPLLYGHQERNRRGGTENITGIIGLGVACQLAQQTMSNANSTIAALRNELEQTVLKTLPFVSANGSEPRVPNTTNLCFTGLHGEELLHKLNKAGVMASLGSACTAGGTDPSHVLLAMGLSREDAFSSLRLSLSKETTDSEVKMLTQIITQVVTEMRSPVNV
ncbi:MAG: aminotransferase class V-fold PLP-dependent enzyme [Methylotenera sp.]|uniref:cysteine desulfurase family protein n=1 Tax=Methylotenera sp. TaxID=2051956 RepID=UPI002489F618|nr:aminotransferase class V-fold PLP-dependent enzyme [Methylotenera sp.]MDI1310388.1 aminotransferase class V-fold PLP-dependent enzyme [Methylotenera sp.]